MAASANKNRAGQAIHDLFREVFALHATLAATMDAVHQQAGLGTSQHRIMRALDRMAPATVPELAAALHVSRQFVQTVCNELLARGYVAFKQNPRHKRSKLAVLTTSGRSAFRQSRDRENRIIQQALPDIEPERVQAARGLLESIRKSLVK